MAIQDNVNLSRRMGRAWATQPIADLPDEQREEMRLAATDGTSGFDDLPEWAQNAIIAGEREKAI